MIHTRKFVIGSSATEELKEYTNLEIYKNCYGSFASNVDENITKDRKSEVCYSQPDLIGGGLTLLSTSRFENKHVFHAYCLAQSYVT